MTKVEGRAVYFLAQNKKWQKNNKKKKHIMFPLGLEPRTSRV